MARSRFFLRFLVLAASALLSLVLVELTLRFYQQFQERRISDFSDYGDVWKPAGREMGAGGFLLEGFRGPVRDGMGGTVSWVNNQQGFRSEREFTSKPAPAVLRILSIGDSFTAGYRVDQEDNFSRRLELWSEEVVGPTEVLLSVVHSPAFALDYLKRFGAQWSPHVVLVGITLGNDIAETYLGLDPARWGEILGPDSPLLPESATGNPVPEPSLFEQLHLFRLFFPERGIIQALPGIRLFDGVHGLGSFLKEPPDQVQAAYSTLFSALWQIQEWATSHGITPVFLLFPQRFQVQSSDWEGTIRKFGLKPEAFDLMAPNRRILQVCQSLDLDCLDPTEAMRLDYQKRKVELYLPRGDMHWNREGHRQLLEAIKAPLLPLLERPLSPTKKGKERDRSFFGAALIQSEISRSLNMRNQWVTQLGFAIACLGSATCSDGLDYGIEKIDRSEVVTRAGAPLFDGMGKHHHPITTSDPAAQLYFDQGLIIDFAFNHAESVRSFRAAQRLDKDCAMCFWGEALALGPNINVTSNGRAIMSDDDRIAAFAAAQKAMALKGNVSQPERDYIEALAARYNGDPATPREPLDEAYAEALRALHQKYPEDDDTASLFAEALMNTMPWDYWLDPQNPKPKTVEVLAALAGVLARSPNHPLALHLYIHAVEVSSNPQRAESAADRLLNLIPGAGQLVHMPAHIY